MDQKAAIKFAPPGMKEWLQLVVGDHKFAKFEADGKWNKGPKSQWLINVDISDINYLEKEWKNIAEKKTQGNRKIVNMNLKDVGIKWNIKFRESRAKGGKSPDAKTTAMQEAGSKYVFEYALNNKKSGWATRTKFGTDKKMMEGLEKIYPDVTGEWLDVFWKQHKVILEKFSNSKINKFDHTGGFMKEITTIVNKNFGISKKDNWNPADIWGVRGNSDKVIEKVQATVSGTKDSQTIQQLNALLRGMYKAKELVGISLKKTSGSEAKWEEYNIEALTLDEVDDYKYKKIDLTMNIQGGNDWTQDTKVNLKQSGGGPEYDFQIKANDSSKFTNLKYESTPTGGRSARGGKAEVKAVEALLKDNEVLGDFKNRHQNYPMNFDQFMSQTIKGRDLTDWKNMYNKVAKKATTNIGDADEFVTNLGKVFATEKPWEANSKLMQLHFLSQVLDITDKEKYSEFWTDMLFLSIKKGDRFGPFGKLY